MMIAHSHAVRSRPRSGFTMVDVVVAASILVIAIGGLSGSVISTMKLNRTNEETASAYAAVRTMTETIQDAEFGEIFATFNSDPNDDPDGAGTAPGSNFDVFGLDTRVDDADGMVGQVLFPTATAGGVLQLREDVVDPALGMPRDLDGDSFADAGDHSADYILLPVTLQLQWRGADGNRQLQLSVLLVE
jgi:type II secretory pathway pseudopilin PulG